MTAASIYNGLASGLIACQLLACSASALAADPPPTQYVFGKSVYFLWDQKLAVYGPYQSQIQSCDNARVYCLSTSFMTILAPKRCADIERKSGLTYRFTTFRNLGRVTFKGPGDTKAEDYHLLHDANQPGVLVGYSVSNGVRFVTAYVLPDRNPAIALSLVSKKDLQKAFDAMSADALMIEGDRPLFPCG